MKPAIRVEDLSKHYKLGERQQGYKTLRESLTDVVAAPFRRFRASPSPQSSVPSPKSSDFWALKDVSFDVQPGEVVGIIGRNGAGKSTLLKVLSRITEPTSGRIELRGRVGSLLEVGTGFHPELTGRENIYMNGSILGMSHREIARKFDEIVAFAEIEEFLDTPVKRYSSGMYVRLAFAVAAHLEPEILIVDEVLAVGDAAFQQKCIGKMKDVARHGRTVIFVSHNMHAISALCSRGLMFGQGMLLSDSDPDTMLKAYSRSIESHAAVPLSVRKDRQGNGSVTFVEFSARGAACDSPDRLATGLPALFTATMQMRQTLAISPTQPVDVAVIIRDSQRYRITTMSTHFNGSSRPCYGRDTAVTIRVARLPLLPGKYEIDLWCGAGAVMEDYIEGAGAIDVEHGSFYGDLADARPATQAAHGSILLDYDADYSFLRKGTSNAT